MFREDRITKILRIYKVSSKSRNSIIRNVEFVDSVLNNNLVDELISDDGNLILIASIKQSYKLIKALFSGSKYQIKINDYFESIVDIDGNDTDEIIKWMIESKVIGLLGEKALINLRKFLSTSLKRRLTISLKQP